MVTASRPVSGQPIDSVWGQQVHDALTDAAAIAIVSSVTSAVSAEAAATVIATLPSITADGTSTYEMEFSVPYVAIGSGVNPGANFYLFDNGASFGGRLCSMGGSGITHPCFLVRRFVPTAGAHVYSVRCASDVVASTVAAGNGVPPGLAPGFLRIRRI